MELDSLKILIIGTALVGGGRERCIAYKNFLISCGFVVDEIKFPEDDLFSKLLFYYQHGLARLRGHEKRHLRTTADLLEKIIKKEKYDVVIGIDTPWSYVLIRDLGCLKIFSCESLYSDELYFSKNFADLDRVHSYKEMELEILEKSDYVVFPWKTTENYVRKYICNQDNFVTIKFGCYPRNKIASYFFPAAIVSLGNIKCYWSNKELLSYLTRISPYVIDVYGKYKPHRRYHINYKGFAPSLNILSNYQFGLNTVSKDIFRKNHFSSRPLSYLAYGLPALSPDWMQYSHELKGCLPFNENNFVDLIDKYSERSLWEKLSEEAYVQAKELDWNLTLKPLEELIRANIKKY